MSGSGEFDIISEVFAPLANNSAAAGLTDDVAVFGDGPVVATKDLLIAGVHFLPSDPLDLVARKLIRVNLSDLAAKGAKPLGYLLGCAWPSTVKRGDIEHFAAGLEEDQHTFKISLFGGDTTVHKLKSGPLTLSGSFFGAPPRGGVIARSGASAGDDVYVSGTIGDAGLGLRVLTRAEKVAASDRGPLAHRYHLPSPRLSLGGALVNLATASIDVSDGLIADAGHIALASSVAIEIKGPSVPLSPAVKRWAATRPDADAAIRELATFGDDYELLFTAPPSMRRSVSMAASASRTEVARIGVVKRGDGVIILDGEGVSHRLPGGGYDHFERS